MALKLALFASGPVGHQVARGMAARGIVPGLLVSDQSFRLLQEQSGESSPVDNGLHFQVESDTDEAIAAKVRLAEIDIGILAWWPRIVREPLLSAPKRGLLNFHPSLLPFNRGKHTTFWNLVEDVPFGVTIHWVDDKIDNGPIAFQRPIAKGWEDDSETLYRRAQSEIVALFFDHLDDIVAGNVPALKPEETSHSRVHYAAEIDAASQIVLERSYTGRELLNVIRGKQFSAHPPAYFIDEGVRYDVRIDIVHASKDWQ